MDDVEVQRLAREFVRAANQTVLPVDLELYLNQAAAVMHTDALSDGESGWSTVVKDKLHITVNGSESSERRRFTVCHELGHHVLGLPSEHAGLPMWSYAKRPRNEILCDVFAAELLLPVHLFKPLVDSAMPGFTFIDRASELAQASVAATCSRFAALASFPCAFVLTEGGKIKYSVRSAPLRAANAWIQARSSLPSRSVTQRVCSGERCDGTEEVDPDLWFADWTSGGTLFEEARYAPKWRQSMTLLWGEEEEIQERRPLPSNERNDDPEYRELDGNLPWPGKKKRR